MGVNIEVPPDPTGLEYQRIFYVHLAPGEEVEWIWTHTGRGSYVSGYTIKCKPVLPE